MKNRTYIILLSSFAMTPLIHSMDPVQIEVESPKIIKAKEQLKQTVSYLYALSPVSLNTCVVDPYGKNEVLKAKRREEREWLYKKLNYVPSANLEKLTYDDLLALTTVIPEGKEVHWKIIIDRYLDLYLLHAYASYGSSYHGPWKHFIMDAITDIRDEKIRLSSSDEQKKP